METVSVCYKAVSGKKGIIEINAPDVPLGIHKMIVWLILNPDLAKVLVDYCEAIQFHQIEVDDVKS